MKEQEPKPISMKVHRGYILKEAQHFKDHKKGVPEWLKNSDDSYIRQEDSGEVNSSDSSILLNFGRKEVMCLDFGGVEHGKLIEHLPYYGSPDAATHGEKSKNGKVSGGHGNGGKYYALSQFEKCEVINYYDKKLTILTLSEDKDYINIQERTISPREIIHLLGLDYWKYFEKHEKDLLNKIINGDLNLFAWRGASPEDANTISNRRSLLSVLSSISRHPQARPVLKSRNVTALLEGDLLWRNIEPHKEDIDENFAVKKFPLPERMGNYRFNTKFGSVLEIKLSKKPLTGEKSSLNVLEIDAFGKNIALYHIPSLVAYEGMSNCLMAHIDCPELKEYNCVSNDRTHLIEGPETSLFERWCRERIRDVLEELGEREKQNEERKHLGELRNFLDNVTDEISDLLEEDDLMNAGFSKSGKENAEVKVRADELGSRKDREDVSDKEDGRENNDEIKKDKGKIKILISNKDRDPLNPERTFPMGDGPRWQILHQRPEDVDRGIWWINSQKKYIKDIDIRSPSAYPFYLFLVKEIILSHRLRKLQKEKSEITPDDIEGENFKLIDEIFNRVARRLGLDLSTNKSNMGKV